MKKILVLAIVATFIFGCKSEEDNTNDNNNVDTTVVEETPIFSDTTEVIYTDEEADEKTNAILEKTEEINNKLDKILSE